MHGDNSTVINIYIVCDYSLLYGSKNCSCSDVNWSYFAEMGHNLLLDWQIPFACLFLFFFAIVYLNHWLGFWSRFFGMQLIAQSRPSFCM